MTNNEAIRLYENLRMAWIEGGIPTSLRAAGQGVPVNMIAADVELLRKLARRIQTIAVNECNRQLSRRENRTRENIIARALPPIMERYPGVKFEVGGDPRGYTLKLHFTPPIGNTMGGPESGYGVAA